MKSKFVKLANELIVEMMAICQIFSFYLDLPLIAGT